MSRYPPIPPSSLTPEQHKAYDEVSETCSSLFGEKNTLQERRRCLHRPLAPLLYTHSLVDPVFKLLVELGKPRGLLGPAREVAILATGGTFGSKYELYTHERVAASTRLKPAQIESVKSGKKSVGEDALDEQGDVAFDVAIELSHK